MNPAMKKQKALLIAIGLLAAFLPLSVGKVSAACGITTEKGRSSSTVTIPQTGNYTLWFRLKPASASQNSAYVQIDGGPCFKIGDNSALPAGRWSWINYSQNGSSQTPITYNFSAGNHSLVIIGSEPDVQIDRTILVAGNCDPSNQRTGSSEPGDNCLTTISTPGSKTNTGAGVVVATTKSGEPIKAVTENTTVSGNVVLDSTIVNNPDVAKVEYYVDSKLIYTSTEMPFHLDTSVLGDGTYTITERVHYKDGRVEERSSSLTINNAEAGGATKSKKSHWLIITGLCLLIFAAFTALILLNPTLRLAIASRLSRLTGRAIRF